jgi:methyltransferase-like protein/cyclopropane fatty-acyl-phospholipid synthase-like methyltransferase
MSDAILASYEEIPYASQPRYSTHPDCLAALGTLFGMRPAPVTQCRVLELGCSTGGNLIPMALTLPESQFVGIDLAPGQIASGQAVVDALGLRNIELTALSILDVDDALGPFDYIICHGVYSWVPPEVQDKILSICTRHLTPHGLAYVSYNTYPGWHLRGMVREMLNFHVRQFDEAKMRVQQARAFLEFLVRSVPDPDGAYARLLKDEADLLRPQTDHYLFHEHLEAVNQPLYFYEFAQRAAAKSLQYVGEAWLHSHWGNLPAEVRTTLQGLSADLLHLEQYLDFLRHRTFRRSVLCHADVKLSRQISPEVIRSFRLMTLARPTSPDPDVGSNAAVMFAAANGDVSVSTDVPIIKAALACLSDSQPRSLSFGALWAAVQERLGLPPAGPDPLKDSPQARQLAEHLLRFYLANLVTLHVHEPPFTVEISARPRASPLARLQAESGPRVTNLWHFPVEVNGFDRPLLRLLDGSRDREALREALMTAATQGALEIQQDGKPITDAAAVRALLGAELEQGLRRLAANSLLMG